MSSKTPCDKTVIICADENCLICYNKSFASRDASVYWSKDNKLPARKVNKGSHEKFKFFHDVCGHTFEKELRKVDNRIFCPYCAIGSSIMCIDENCDHCHKRSFASSKTVHFWDQKLNEEKPREILNGSKKKYHMKCSICKHNFMSSPGDLNHPKVTYGCPYCGSMILCSDNNCEACFNKSFASSKFADLWSAENSVNSRSVFKHAQIKRMFYCNLCKKKFSSCPDETNVYGCSCTKHKTEAKLFEWLKSNYKDLVIEKQKKFDWCRKIHRLPFDFVIESLKIIIELDGGQHFVQVSCWNSPEKTQQNDVYKMKCANENGYSVIRLLQINVYDDKNNWEQFLRDAIQKCDGTCNIYIDVDDIYANHIKLMDE